MQNLKQTFGWLASIGMGALLLTACGNSNSSSSSVHQNTATDLTKSSQARSTTHKATPSALWDPRKAEQLSSFMESFGQTMDQSYTACTPGHNTTYAGLHYPDDLKQRRTAFDDQKLSAGWAPTGKGHYRVNVVAVYEDPGQGTLGGHVYLFAIKDGKAVVYHTSQNQGMPDNLTHFTTTENQTLRQGFAKIVAGQQVALPNKSSSSKKAVAPTHHYVKFVFPQWMQGTWYSADDDGKIEKLVVTGNLLNTDGVKTPTYDGASRTAADMKVLNGDGKPDPAKTDWGAGGLNSPSESLFDDPSKVSQVVNVRGWYQGAGDGTYFYTSTEKDGGQPFTVLTQAGGAGMWLTAHYYRSVDLAKQHQDEHYSTDRDN
ncbi:DUF4767 domain-containing protein [Pediococcus acidilactici]|uniref:DUF4767 domain-containing protein n=1 Tax=Pediococcus acidilactici TaxID=1254 RepID=UPI00232B582A|nr:DUF4767 domain-containing protein [Pediococcus acidilactici]MDB8869011.1 DUF4767 domain-containing protein [Pediococcus acidilactici]